LILLRKFSAGRALPSTAAQSSTNAVRDLGLAVGLEEKGTFCHPKARSTIQRIMLTVIARQLSYNASQAPLKVNP
jgi:hypothetical protein